MFNNKLHIGQLFGLILLAPAIMFGVGILNEYSVYGFSEDVIFMLVVWAVLTVSAFGLMAKEVWALKVTSILIIGTLLLAMWGMTMDTDITEEPFTFIGLIMGFACFAFGAVALLNNKMVLDAFDAEENHNEFDDILDA